MEKKILIFILVLILVGVYWQWWLPGPKVANDFPLVSSSALKSFMNFPQSWNEFASEGLGEYTVFTLWSWPFMFLSSILANLGLSFILIERFLIMIPFLFLGIWGMWKLGEDLKLSNFSKFFSTLFYLTNSYILLVLDGGQLSIGLAYVFFPISFLIIKNSINKGFKYKILAALSVWLLGCFDFRFIYILILLSLIYFLYGIFLNKDSWKRWIVNWLSLGLTTGFIVVGLNAYWLIPLSLTPLADETISSLTQTNFVSQINLAHPIFMLAPNWFKNVFGQVSPLRFEFIILPLLAFAAPVLRPKDRKVGFWLLIALFSIFLAKGFSEPLGVVYQWLFKNAPGFSLFRDSTKFFFPLALSYALLIGITLDEILRRFKDFKRVKVVILSFLVFCLLIIVRPIWTFQMTGTFSIQPKQKDYQILYHFLEGDKKFSKMLWLPSIPPLGPVSLEHPSLEASRLVQKRPFGQGVVGSYETFNFMREASYMGQIFDVAGIGYIVYPYLDQIRYNLDPDNIKYYYLFSSQLSKLPWVDRVKESPVPIWKVKHQEDKFFITQNTYWILGSDNIYKEATKSANLNLSKNSLIFADEFPNLGNKLDLLPDAKIILNSKTGLDLAASFIEGKNLIFPAKNLTHDPDTSGWWRRETKDFIGWKDFLKTKYGVNNQDFDLGGGWAIGEGKLELKIKSSKFEENKIILARVLESTRSGQLKFYQGGDLIGEVDTKKSGDNVRWFEVGKLKGGEDLRISSEGEINVINALAILDENQWMEFQEKVKGLKGRISNFENKNISESEPSVTYQKIVPTKYKVTIKNLKREELLIFSQNFNDNWKLNSQAAIPVYSLLNGFRIEKDGEYILEFDPQKYVNFGLIIFGLTILSVLILLIRPSKSS